jgi:hypothetical protein
MASCQPFSVASQNFHVTFIKPITPGPPRGRVSSQCLIRPFSSRAISLFDPDHPAGNRCPFSLSFFVGLVVGRHDSEKIIFLKFSERHKHQSLFRKEIRNRYHMVDWC